MKNFLRKIEFIGCMFSILEIKVVLLSLLLLGCTGAPKLGDQEAGQKYFKAVGICDIEEIKSLRATNNISINFQNSDQVNGLMLSGYKGNMECVKFFLESGIDINARDINLRNALFYSMESKKLEICKLLIEKGIEFNQIDRFNLTALMVASKAGLLEVVAELIKRGASVNQADENGWTALFFAVAAKNKAVVTLLIEAGSNIFVKDSDGKTPRDIAYDDLTFEISDYLEEIAKAQNQQQKVKPKAKNN